MLSTRREMMGAGLIQMQVTMSDHEMEFLVRYAVTHGYSRENPKVGWKLQERKGAARFALSKLIMLGGFVPQDGMQL